MQNSLKNLFPLLLAAMFAQAVMAQKISFDGVLDAKLDDMGAIYNQSEVNGYYFLYETDKADKGNRKYLLQILDQNLNKLSDQSIVDHRTMELREGAYNGQSLMLKFSDLKEDKYTYRQYDKQGQKKDTRSAPMSKYEQKIYTGAAGQNTTGLGSRMFFPVPGKGYVNYALNNTKGMMSQTTYEISYLPEAESDKGWKASSSEQSDDFESAAFLAVNDKVLVSSLVRRPGLMSKDIEYHVMAHDLDTGKKMFENSIEDSKYACSIINARFENEVIQLFGLYYDKDDKISKAKSIGICIFEMDLSGKINKRHYLTWARDVSKVLPVNVKGKIEDVGYLYFHDFIKTADGKLFGIAENYRKAASGLGIASRALGGGGSLVKIVVEDFYVLEFSPDFTLNSAKIFDKEKTSIELGDGSEFVSTQLLGHWVKAFGGFDYEFTQVNSDRSVFSVGYLDWDNKGQERDGFVFGAINYADGEVTADKMKLGTRANRVKIFPAKPGYVVIFEYFRKTKSMDFRLEKINF